MAQSIPGGATMAADGKTWQDAAGKPLEADQIAAIEDLHARRTAERNEAEALRMAAEARSNPIANALLAALGRAPQQPTIVERERQAATREEERRARTETAAAENEAEHRADVAARKGR